MSPLRRLLKELQFVRWGLSITVLTLIAVIVFLILTGAPFLGYLVEKIKVELASEETNSATQIAGNNPVIEPSDEEIEANLSSSEIKPLPENHTSTLTATLTATNTPMLSVGESETPQPLPVRTNTLVPIILTEMPTIVPTEELITSTPVLAASSTLIFSVTLTSTRTIRGVIWNDQDENRCFDHETSLANCSSSNNDEPLADLLIRLASDNGMCEIESLLETKTESNGTYLFRDVSPGSYCLFVGTPSDSFFNTGARTYPEEDSFTDNSLVEDEDLLIDIGWN